MKSTSQRIIPMLTLGAICGVAMCLWNPVNATLYRLGLLACLSGAWLGGLILLWKTQWCRVFLLGLAIISLVPFCLPGGEIESDALRKSYVKRMQDLEGTVYNWGGESSRGIDCSGLPRKAYRDALLAYGIRHGNGDACRMFLEQWWFDTSAEALGQGYRGFTANLNQAGEIKEMPYDSLQPGDIAVTASGVHALVYFGDNQWIQADPGIGYVATLDGRKDSNPWFSQPVSMYRWSVLAE
jgi:hypothetical protein